MFECEINGKQIIIKNTSGLFSPLHADRGTLAMLSVVELSCGMKVLDLGCGCGIVGIYSALCCGQENIVMCDIDPLAVESAAYNAEANGLKIASYVSDGLASVPEAGFDVILSNPPYQSDFAVAKHFIEKGFNRLKIGGQMYMVTKRRTWYENKLRAIFGGCKVYEIDGYFVFKAEKRSASYAKLK